MKASDAAAMVARSHPVSCRCTICFAAAGDEVAMAEVLNVLER